MELYEPHPTMHSSKIPQYTILEQKCTRAHMFLFLVHNCELFVIELMRCGICATGQSNMTAKRILYMIITFLFGMHFTVEY